MDQPGSRHLVCCDSRDPPPGVAGATAPPTRGRRRFSAPIGCRPPADLLSPIGELEGALDEPLGRAQRALRLVDCRHQIVTFAAEVRPGEVTRRAGGNRRSPRRRHSARRRWRSTRWVHIRAAPVTSPIVEVDPVPPCDDVRALGRYHSPRVDVPVRLNVNESPYPPPDGWREELATRRPPSSGTAIRSGLRVSCGRRSRSGTASAPIRSSPPMGRTRCCRRSC